MGRRNRLEQLILRTVFVLFFCCDIIFCLKTSMTNMIMIKLIDQNKNWSRFLGARQEK